MSLSGDYNIKLDALKAWARQLDAEVVMAKIPQSGILGNIVTNLICRKCLRRFKKAIENLKEGDDWRSTQEVLNPALMTTVFMVSDNAIQVGDYYECLLTYADVSTKKKLTKGFQYKDIGEVNISDEAGNVIGQIGMKSDLIWSCLYRLFIHEDSYSADHTLPDHEEILSIQFYDTFGKTEEEIRQMVDEIIFKCSREFDLNFQHCHLDSLIREVGVQGHYELKTSMGEFEDVPMMYFNNALGANDARIKYLSYYQVMEYFFNRAQNINLLDDIRSGGYVSSSSVDHAKLKKLLKDYVGTTKESESLKLVLKKAVDVSQLKAWIQDDPDRNHRYTNSGSPDKDLNLSKPDEKIISKLAERVYSYRCSIAHAKGDVEEYIALPEVGNGEIEKELPLVRYLAIETISHCSRW